MPHHLSILDFKNHLLKVGFFPPLIAAALLRALKIPSRIVSVNSKTANGSFLALCVRVVI